ncbi:MAG: porin [Thiotrichales bacterium]|nr:MAG: porin [Thiotrichales bacterium]
MRITQKRFLIFLCCNWLFVPPIAQGVEPAATTEPVTEPIEKAETFVVTDEVRERELSAGEDPLAQEQSELMEAPEEVIAEPDALRLYGSLRIRYRDTDSGSFWGDGGSRFGVFGRWQFKPETWLIGRGEAGFNLLDTADLLFNRGDRPPGSKLGDEVFLRLLYLGVETTNINVTAGKNWSTYYRVSSFTDRFQGTGASASGTYNAGTDGGYTGTGRADNVLQTRGLAGSFRPTSMLKPLNINFQVQHGRPIPRTDGFNYETTIGISSVLETDEGIAVGLAYNHANIDDADLPALGAIGIDGDATAAIVGLRWYGDAWYFGTIVSRLNNHETTARNIYFDGTGWEIYAQYRVFKQWWVVGGWNMLEPDSDQIQAGDFNIDYNVIGLRYSFQGFRQMIFANARLENSTTQDGVEIGNVYTIGVRWDLP